MRICHRRVTMRPITTWVERVPRRSQVGACFRVVPMFANSVTDSHFTVPNRFEEINQVGLGSGLPSALDGESPKLEILQAERGLGLCNVLSMVTKASRESISLLDDAFAIRIRRIGFADIDGMFSSGYALIGWKVAIVIDRVNAGAVEALKGFKRLAGLSDHRNTNDAAHNIRVGEIKNEPWMMNRVEVFYDVSEIVTRRRNRLPEALSHSRRKLDGFLAGKLLRKLSEFSRELLDP